MPQVRKKPPVPPPKPRARRADSTVKDRRSPLRLSVPAPILDISANEGLTDQHPETTKKVLFITSRFPPVASAGAVRIRKFVKYLPRSGWQPIVLTGATRRGKVDSHDARRAVDLESLDDLPAGLVVVRVGETADQWPRLFGRNLARRLSRFTRGFGVDAHGWSGALEWRLTRIHDALAFPDRGIFHLPDAVRTALALHRTHRFDAVFSSGMPFSDHLIALVVSSLIRRPWVADFRDPWVNYVHWPQWSGTAGRLLTRASEAAVVARAARVITVNDHMTRSFAAHHARQDPGKFVTITNGFDPRDFPTSKEEVRRPSSTRPFRILYAGSLYGARSPHVLLDGFRRFVAATPGAAERCRLDFAGRPGPFAAELVRDHDPSAGAPGEARRVATVGYLGMIPHARAQAEMAASDVNVILLPDIPGGTGDSTAKLYECIGCGRAILAIVPPDGAAAEELRRHDGVWLCAPRDVDVVADALGDLYRRWRAGGLVISRSREFLRPLTRAFQAEQLARQLDAVAARSHRETARRGEAQPAGADRRIGGAE